MSNVIIDGNIIDYGYGTSDNATPILYSYNFLVNIDAPCTITNNNFSGIASYSGTGFGSTHLHLGQTCIVSNNNFIRGTNTVYAYIYGNGQSGTITNNIFDSFVVDNASNEILVRNISGNMIYHSNKNQTGYASIAKTNSNVSISAPASSSYSYSSFGSLESFVVNYNSVQTSANANAYCVMDLNKYLPMGVTLLSAVVGVYFPFGDIVLQANSFFNLSFVVSRSLNYSLTSLTGTVADAAFSNNNGGSGYTGGDQSNSVISSQITVGSSSGQIPSSSFNTATQYVTVDFTSLSNYYVTSYNNQISAEWHIDAIIANADNIHTVDSPIIIRYRW